MVDPRDMLNNFCFHVCAQKSLFIAENCNVVFLTTAACEFGVSRAGSQLKRESSVGTKECNVNADHIFRIRVFLIFPFSELINLIFLFLGSLLISCQCSCLEVYSYYCDLHLNFC